MIGLAIAHLYSLPAIGQAAAEPPRAWKTLAQRHASSAAYCPAGPLLFDLMSDGATLNGKDQGGATFKVAIGPDGSVNVTYRTSAGRPARIVGNARTGQLQLLAGPNDACRYEFAAVRPEDSTPLTQVRAQSARICEQTIEYRPAGTPSPTINGVWEGTIDFGSRYKSCHGFAVEGLIDKNTIVVQHAWNNSNGANSDIRGMVYMGKGAGVITQQPDGSYTIGKSFILRLVNNRLVGTYHSENDRSDHDVVLYKQ